MLLELKQVKKYFISRKGLLAKPSMPVRAVDGVDLVINQGEHLSIVGESGCGKTTLARIILKLIDCDAGEIYFKEQSATRWKADQLKAYRKNVQMVFQDPYSSLDPRFTIRGVMREAMTLEQEKYQTADGENERIIQLLRAVGLKADILNRYPHEFSGGERQRIAIARALVLNPALLVLDEAVSSLDVLIQKQILDLLSDLKNQFELTYLFISHNLKVVRKLSQRIAVMYKGRIVELAATEAIFNNPLHAYTKQLLSAALDYKAVEGNEIILPEGGQLVDQGNNHFVMTD